jgi:hypothetical protein
MGTWTILAHPARRKPLALGVNPRSPSATAAFSYRRPPRGTHLKGGGAVEARMDPRFRGDDGTKVERSVATRVRGRCAAS